MTFLAFSAGFTLGVLALVPAGAFDDEVAASVGQVVFVWVMAFGFAIVADLLFARRLWALITNRPTPPAPVDGRSTGRAARPMRLKKTRSIPPTKEAPRAVTERRIPER
jgi:hypothetical protein